MGYWDNPANMGGSTNQYGNYTVADNVPQELLHLVHSHWYQYPPMNPLMYSLVAMWMFVTGTLAVCGNFVVIWVFMNTKSLRTPANYFIVSLAMSDFLMMFYMCPVMLYNSFYGKFMFGPSFCAFYALWGSVSGCASIWAMVFITLDRYNVIVKGIAGTPLTNGGALLRLLFVWTWAIVWSIPPLFGFNNYVLEGNLTACGTDYLSDDLWTHLYLYFYASACYFIPLLIIIYSYTFILKAVANHEKQMREQAKKMGVKSLRSDPEANKTSAECRLAKVALMTVSLWFMAWTPYMIINMVGLNNKAFVTPLFSIWGSVFAKANSVYNPIVYGISHPKYRAAMEKKLPCLACNTEREEHSDGAATEATSTNEKC